METKLITGADLIELGYKPAKWFGEALDHLNSNNIHDLKSIEDVCNRLIKLNTYTYMEPLETPVPYYKNIETENDVELENLISVEATMHEAMKTPTIVKGAIMPDACPAGPIGHIPVGGVIVSKNAIHPAMHSADICCSVMLTGFGSIEPKRILDLMSKITDFGAGPRKNKELSRFELPKNLGDRMAANPYFDGLALAMAKSHLGTQGDGNHFAFVGRSKNTSETSLVTHHGSRGLGARVYKFGMAKAESWRKKISPNSNKINAWIPFETQDGQEYWEALQLVREWTKLNHEVLHNWIVDKVKYVSKTHFWNEHNFVFKKDDLFYHAKGSTPLLDEFVPDNNTGLRIIPLNMAEPILIVKGNITEENLGFAPHGAGRNMSRTKFLKGTDNFEDQIKGLDIRFHRGVADLSEYPSAYKNAQSVREQITKFNMGEVVDEILPYGCIMAGNGGFERG